MHVLREWLNWRPTRSLIIGMDANLYELRDSPRRLLPKIRCSRSGARKILHTVRQIRGLVALEDYSSEIPTDATATQDDAVDQALKTGYSQIENLVVACAGEYMLKGKCLCEGVTIEIDAPLGPVIACHCSLCRRSTGSAFNPNASVPADRFRITSGQELVREFSRAPGAYRAFCSQCGSPLYGRSDDYPTIRRVRLGTLENSGGARLIAHIFTGSKADWFEINDGMEQFDEWPTDPMRYFKTAD